MERQTIHIVHFLLSVHVPGRPKVIDAQSRGSRSVSPLALPFWPCSRTPFRRNLGTATEDWRVAVAHLLHATHRPTQSVGHASTDIPRGTAPTPSETLIALQRSAGNRAVAAAVQGEEIRTNRYPALLAVQRDRQPAPSADPDGTGIKVEPGPIEPGLVGSRLPLPASLSVAKPGSGRGSRLTMPSFTLRLDPRGIVAGLLDHVSLGGLQLSNPTLIYSAGVNAIFAAGTVSIPTRYPGWDTPTNIEISVKSTGLERFDAEATSGAWVADLTLDLAYDSARLESVLGHAALANFGAIRHELKDFDRDVRFRISGSAGPGGSARKLPLTFLRGSGSISSTSAHVHGGAAGLMALPSGTFHPQLAAPAVGAAFGSGSTQRKGDTTGRYGFGGITGTLSIPDLLTGNIGDTFTPFAYAQVAMGKKTAEGHRFGIKVSVQYELGSTQKPGNPIEHVRSNLYDRRQRERYNKRPNKPDLDPAMLSHWRDFEVTPLSGAAVNAVLSSTFDLLGGR